MKKLFVTCALIMAAVLVTPGTASAQATGDVDVAITVNGFVILYYYNDIDILIPSNVMAQALAGADVNGGIGSALGAAVSTTSPGSGAMTAPVAAPPTSSDPSATPVTLTIENAWSIRGLVSTTVDVTVTGFSNLTSAGSGFIAVPTGACAGACTGLTPTLGAALSGGVDLDLDFSSITAPDTFASAATYTIIATVL